MFEFTGIEMAPGDTQAVEEVYEPLYELNTYGDGGADRYVHV
jgi:hypothetical protein